MSEIPLKEENKTNNWRRTHYWRMCFRTLVLVLYNTCARPSELVGKIEKVREAQRKDHTWLKDFLMVGYFGRL